MKYRIYSAGLKRRDVEQKCIVAGIQSIFRIAETLGRFDLVIVDEAHMIPSKGEGMYRSCFEKLKSANPHLRVIGLTATPYRMTSGLICKPENILNHICYEVGIKSLMADGFLAKLTSKASRKPVDTENLHLRGGEFIEKEMQALMNADSCVSDAVAEIVSMTHDRQAVLIFCAGVAHAESVMKELRRYSDSVAGVFGDTLPFLREETLEHFKTWKLRPESNDNHWFDGIVGCAVAGSMSGAVLPGTDTPRSAPRAKIRLSELQKKKS